MTITTLIQTLSLIVSIAAIVIISYYWYCKRVAVLYLLPPLVIYLSRAVFYSYILLFRPAANPIITAFSAHLVFLELSVGLGILIAAGEKMRNDHKAKVGRYDKL
jgi:hypothetical protein